MSLSARYALFLVVIVFVSLCSFYIMCKSPIIIRNPYCGCDPTKGYNYLHDCISTHIAVPCGHCLECIQSRQSSFCTRCDLEGFGYRSVPYMLTLTYDDAHIPRMEKAGDVLDDFAYPDWSHVRNMMKRLRHVIERHTDKRLCDLFSEPDKVVVKGRERVLPPFKYLFCAEFGRSSLRPHFHALIYVKSKYDVKDTRFESWASNVEKILGDWFKENWSVNIGSIQVPVYDKLYTFVQRGNRRTFDFHRIVPSEAAPLSSPSYYVTKYLFKPCKHLESFRKKVWFENQEGRLSDARYDEFMTYIRRNLRISKYFGYPFAVGQMERLNYSLALSVRRKLSVPMYLGTDGKTQVYPQYLKRFITPDIATYFAYNIKNQILSDYETIRKSVADTFEFRDSEIKLQALGDIIRTCDDCLGDLPNYRMWNNESSRKTFQRECSYYDKRYHRKPDFCSGLAYNNDFYGQPESKDSGEVIELYLFNNPINIEEL